MRGKSLAKRRMRAAGHLWQAKNRYASWRCRRFQRMFEALEDRTLLNAHPTLALLESPVLQLEPNQYDTSDILVRFQPEAGCNALGCDSLPGAEILEGTSIGPGSDLVSGLHQVQLADGVSVEAALEAYRAHPLVAYAEPDYQITLTGIPNDPRFAEQWNLHNFGQTGGTVDADVDAPRAWEVNTGSGNTVVAVIDSGVDYTHPDLAANMWKNPGEIPADGIDNDGNGLVDDVFGYDWANNDGDPFDDNGHGTHVAGILGAVGDNAVGIAGVNWNIQIMALKFTDAAGNGTIASAVAALNYAVAHGATISNNSWGTSQFSSALRDAVVNARAAGHLVVAAAGNSAADIDQAPFYPASFDLDNVVAVAATNSDDGRAGFSNFGASSVDLAAPGVGILSTVPAFGAISDPTGYRLSSGTSMATPHVTGVAALLRDLQPKWSYSQIRERILRTVDPLADLQGATLTGGRLNAAAALTGLPFQFNVGSFLSDTAADIVTDDDGNVYVTGSFYETNAGGSRLPDFDPSNAVSNVRNRGDTDVFVAKYAETGQLLWARSMGGQSRDEALAVAVDGNGNVYTTGRFSGIADFDPGSAEFLLADTSSGGSGDLFVSKLDRDGDFLWARNFAGSAAVGTDIGIDGTGEVYLTGEFFGTADFDPGPGVFQLGSLEVGVSHVFVASIDPAGNFRWAREFGQNTLNHSVDVILDCGLNLANCNNAATGLAVSESGDVFLTGSVNVNSGSDHVFLSRLSRNGGVVWSQVLDAVPGARSVSTGVALADANTLFVAGHFLGAADFDPGASTAIPINNGGTDVFVARYDAATGALVWVRNVGGLEDDRALSLTTDAAGFVYATGTFRGTVDFDPGVAEVELISISGSDDVFVWKLDAGGHFNNVLHMGGPDLDAATGIAMDPFGNLALTGIFRDKGNFSLDLNASPLTSNGGSDIFVTKIVQMIPPSDPVPAPPPPPPSTPAQMALFRGGLWFLDLDHAGARAERTFAFGIASDAPVAGDWDGDGATDAAVFRNGTWFFDLDGAGGRAERRFAFGITGDIPVAGDWNGDGITEAAVFRNGVWYFDLDGAGGSAEAAFAFGVSTDTPVPGDWNGDGSTDAAVFRGGKWFFDLDDQGRRAERAFAFGIHGDMPLAGDWDGDGRTDAAVFRGGKWYFDLDGNGGAGESAAVFGIGGDSPLAGLWEQIPAPAEIASLLAASAGSRSLAEVLPLSKPPHAANASASDPTYNSAVHPQAATRAVQIQPKPRSIEQAVGHPWRADLVDEALMTLCGQWSEADLLELLEPDLIRLAR